MNDRVARPKTRQTENYLTGEFSALADAGAMEAVAGASNDGQKGSFSLDGIEYWARVLSVTNGPYRDRILNAFKAA